MTMNWEFTIGNLLTIVMFGTSAITAIMLIRADVRILGLRISALEKTNETQNAKIDKLSELVTLFARYEEKFLAMDRRIEDLRHGKGWVIEDFNQYGKVPPKERPS